MAKQQWRNKKMLNSTEQAVAQAQSKKSWLKKVKEFFKYFWEILTFNSMKEIGKTIDELIEHINELTEENEKLKQQIKQQKKRIYSKNS